VLKGVPSPTPHKEKMRRKKNKKDVQILGHWENVE
jgi:hypothetical protein